MPSFEEQGFEVTPLGDEEARSWELQTSFPFGRLRRSDPRGLHLVEIQLHNLYAGFRLNIGVAPAGGLDHPLVGRIAQEEIWVHYLARYLGAYSCPYLQRWFAVRRGWFGPPATNVDYDNLVGNNLGLVRELEDALREGKRGQHIRVVEV